MIPSSKSAPQWGVLLVACTVTYGWINDGSVVEMHREGDVEHDGKRKCRSAPAAQGSNSDATLTQGSILIQQKMDQKGGDSSDLEGKEKLLNVVEDEEESELDGLVGEEKSFYVVEEDEENEEAGENDQESGLGSTFIKQKTDQKERDSSDLEGKEKSLNVVEGEKENELAGLVGKEKSFYVVEDNEENEEAGEIEDQESVGERKKVCRYIGGSKVECVEGGKKQICHYRSGRMACGAWKDQQENEAEKKEDQTQQQQRRRRQTSGGKSKRVCRYIGGNKVECVEGGKRKICHYRSGKIACTRR